MAFPVKGVSGVALPTSLYVMVWPPWQVLFGAEDCFVRGLSSRKAFYV